MICNQPPVGVGEYLHARKSKEPCKLQFPCGLHPANRVNSGVLIIPELYLHTNQPQPLGHQIEYQHCVRQPETVNDYIKTHWTQELLVFQIVDRRHSQIVNTDDVASYH